MWPPFLRAETVGPTIKFLQSVLAVATFSSTDVPHDPQVSDGAEYDFIVVGGGTAGAVVATRLAAAARVLLAEAGGPPPPQAQIPGLFPLVAGTKYDWNHVADTSPNACRAQKGKLKLVRSKMLGGSAGADYLHHVLGHPADYDAWAALAGDPSWSYRHMARFIQDTESVQDDDILSSPQGYLRGRDGYINITRQIHRKETLKYFKAFFEAGHKISHDYNTAHNSFSEGQFTIGGGQRSSSTAYLKRNQPNLLHVLTHTRVTKVLFEDNKAIAVQAITRAGKTITIKANAEIILSAGPINTPLILMQSGIGPREHLQEHNIELLADLPVGENLQDHVSIPIVLTGDNSSAPDPTTIHEFPLPTIVGFVSLNDTGARPDYQVLAYPAARGSKYPLLFCHGYGVRDEICNQIDDAASRQQTLVTNIVLLHPDSSGRVRLSKNDSKQASIYMGYYDIEQDLERHVSYVEDFLRVLNTTFFKSVQSKVVDLNLEECKEEEFGSRGYWVCYARSMATSLRHPVGTTGLGAVLDARLRVRHTSRLRVADASAVPAITSGNTNAPVALLAEHAAQLIKEDHGLIY